jgi:peptidoglycan/LPS O-acetylase OafA/YrhL
VAGVRIRGLDGLRGIAILLVMVYHQTVAVGSTVVDRFVGFWTLSGWVGVDLFFVLSGFLITGILFDSRKSTGYFRNFYARRVLRIFPLYYAVVAFSLFILPHVPHWKLDSLARINGDEVWYWTYLSNFSIGAHAAFRHGILDISWSLAIEEQFYLTWPLLILLLSRRWLMGVCCALFVLALVWRSALIVAGVSPITVAVLTPGRLDALATGAFIALLARTTPGLPRLKAWAPAILVGSAAVIFAVAVRNGDFNPYTGSMALIGYTALALLFGAVLVLVLSAEPTWKRIRLLEQPALVAFGKYSYALYLFHLPIRAVIRDKVYTPDQFMVIMGSSLPGQLIFYVGATLATFAAAWLSWHLFESHLLALKRYFEPRALESRGVAAPVQGNEGPERVRVAVGEGRTAG